MPAKKPSGRKLVVWLAVVALLAACGGVVWLERLSSHYRRSAWLNPTPKQSWSHVRSITIVNDLMEGRMFPLTVNGIDEMTKELSR